MRDNINRKLNIAICEDDPAQRQYLETLVLQWSQREEIGCRVDCYQSAEQLYFSFNPMEGSFRQIAAGI